MQMRLRVVCSVALAGVLFAQVAAAQSDDATMDEARALARKALDDLDAERWKDALDAAEKAEQLYHAPIHLLAIARALEGLGRLAEAADTYERLVAEPLPPRGATVFKQAQDEGAERLRKLLARVPSLLVSIRGPAASAATVTVDGKPFSHGDVARRMDPGKHVVRVQAEGYEAHEETVVLPARGGAVVVDVTLRRKGEPPPNEPPIKTPPATSDEGPSPYVVPTAIAFSVGAVGLGVGAVTGGLFLSQVSDLKDSCPNDRCPASVQEDLDGTSTLGNVTTAALAVGGAGAAVGVVLLGVWLSQPDAEAKPGATAKAAVMPEIGPGWIGLRVVQ